MGITKHLHRIGGSMEILIHVFEVTPQISWVFFFFALLFYVHTSNTDSDHVISDCSGNVFLCSNHK